MTNVAFSDGISNCKCFFSWQVFFCLLSFYELNSGTAVDIWFRCSTDLPSMVPFLTAHIHKLSFTVQCLFSRTLSWCKSAPFCEHQQSFTSSHQLQMGFWAPGALGSREAMKQANGKNILKVSSDLCLHSLKMRFELQPPTMNSELLTAQVLFLQSAV